MDRNVGNGHLCAQLSTYNADNLCVGHYLLRYTLTLRNVICLCSYPVCVNKCCSIYF